MEYVNILLQAKKLNFDVYAFKLIDIRKDEYVIPYEEIVLVQIAQGNGEEQSLKTCYIPEITEITKDTTGALVICNRQQNRFVIRMDLVKDTTAGSLLQKLTRYAPHALFGFQPWLNEYDDEQFKEILEMTDIMKTCVK